MFNIERRIWILTGKRNDIVDPVSKAHAVVFDVTSSQQSNQVFLRFVSFNELFDANGQTYGQCDFFRSWKSKRSCSIVGLGYEDGDQKNLTFFNYPRGRGVYTFLNIVLFPLFLTSVDRLCEFNDSTNGFYRQLLHKIDEK